MKLLDLCAGIGGFSLAAHWLGWQTEAFCERDKFCQKVLTKNFPGVPIYDDVFTFPSKSFRGRIDVLTAGFPCQPFSAAGKRKGRDDERHIFPQIMDIVGKVQPTWCVFENVRGLLSIESGQVYAEIIASLESEGFEVITHCVPASALNAPHRRDRLWIVAYSYTNRVTRQSQQDVEPSTRIEPPGLAGIGQLGAEASERIYGRFEQPNCGTANANREGLQGSDERANRAGQSKAGFGLRDRNDWHEPWIDVATRTCVRGMDDGLSDGLHVTGSRDNRVNRLKALGNSIVPQIAYELFKAIDAAEKKTY